MKFEPEEYADFLLDVMFKKTDTITNFVEFLNSPKGDERKVATIVWHCMDKAWALGFEEGRRERIGRT